MTADELKDICLCGETTKVQFKEAPIPQKELAREMIAFANSKGGVMLFGVEDKTGEIKESANQFKVTVWRTIQKNETTIQKDNSTIQKDTLKDNPTIQKSNSTIQKKDSTIQKDLDTTQKKVLDFFSENPMATIDEAVAAIDDLSLGGVKFTIGKLQQKGLLKRMGGRKHGSWLVLLP